MTCLLPPQNAIGQNSQPGDQFFGINASNHNRVMIFAGGVQLTVDGKIVWRGRRQRRQRRAGSGRRRGRGGRLQVKVFANPQYWCCGLFAAPFYAPHEALYPPA